MPSEHSFASFEKELNRLVATFEKNFAHYKKPGYDEASLRQEFLNPLFSALGWDVENKAGRIPQKREVEVESRTQIGGRAKRADYLFRTDGRDRFVCEAKKPADDLGDRPAFQAKRYAWNKDLPLAVLTDFEEMKIYVVGGKPHADEPHVGEWKTWTFRQYPLVAQELWDLLSREKVAGGAIDTALDALPKKKPTGKGKAKQQWLIKPDRSRALDTDFLEFLDEARRDLASDLYKHNDHATLIEGNLLNESVQCILDRILFLRICEDRDIDTGTTLQNIVETWRRNYGHDEGRKFSQESLRLREDSTLDLDDDARSGGGGTGGSRIAAPRESLWYAIVRHFRALDRRPPSHVPFFNGNLFKLHGSERLLVGDEWLANFIGELSNDETPYLFNVIPVEILGSVYERFLGKVVRPHGKGIVVEEKPEVRKAGGVYYTPRYIVDYIVEQTVGRQLDAIAGGENDASVSGRRASGSAGAPPAVPGVPAGNTGDAHGDAADRPGAARTTGMSSAGARTTAGGAPALPVSNVLPRAVRLAEFEKATAALRILDPACGSGSFLIRAFERVCEHWQTWLTAQLPKEKTARAAWEKKHRKLCWVDAETGDVHLTVDLKRRILTENIYGVDLDSAAVEVTQLSLYLKMLENENRTTLQRERELFADEVALLPPLQDNIKCGNSLIASDFSMMSEDLVRVNAFDWEVGFRKIMKAGGFDAVIGNPPWGASLVEDEAAHLTRAFPLVPTKTKDTYFYFILTALRILKSGRPLGFIVPNTWLLINTADEFRRELLDYRLLELVDYGDGVFPDATVESVTLVLEKSLDRDFPCRAVRKKDGQVIKDHNANKDFWRSDPSARIIIDLDAKTFALVERLRGITEPFERDCVIIWGIKPYQVGYGKPPQTRQMVEKRVFHASEKHGSEWKPLLVGTDVNRYSISFPGKLFIRYGPWLMYPSNETLMLGPKILLRQTSDILRACFDSTGYYCQNSVFIIHSESVNLRFLLGLLNSSLLKFLYQLGNPQTGKVFAEIKPSIIKQLPIRCLGLTDTADKARHDKLVMLVEKMLALTPKLRAAKTDSEKATLQNAVTATDRQIDQLVYELYGLTPEEIALVEGGK